MGRQMTNVSNYEMVATSKSLVKIGCVTVMHWEVKQAQARLGKFPFAIHWHTQENEEAKAYIYDAADCAKALKLMAEYKVAYTPRYKAGDVVAGEGGSKYKMLEFKQHFPHNNGEMWKYYSYYTKEVETATFDTTYKVVTPPVEDPPSGWKVGDVVQSKSHQHNYKLIAYLGKYGDYNKAERWRYSKFDAGCALVPIDGAFNVEDYLLRGPELEYKDNSAGDGDGDVTLTLEARVKVLEKQVKFLQVSLERR